MENANIEILMIEDDLADAELATQAFRKNRLANKIQIVHDGKEALEYLFCKGAHSGRNPAQMPVLILLDLKLPAMDGIEVLRQIRLCPRTTNLPVIVMTSSKTEQDIVRSSKLGINGYVLKPMDYNQFLDTVNRLAISWLILDAHSAEEVFSEKQERANAMPELQNKESSLVENPVRLLFIEDSQGDVASCIAELKRAGLAVTIDVVETRERFIEQVRAKTYDLILADYRLPTWKGTEAIHLLKQLGISIPVIVVTGNLGEESSGECMRLGVTDLVLKDHLPRLPMAVGRALREESLRRESLHAKEELAKANDALSAQVGELNRLSEEAKLIREVGDLLQTCVTTAEACQVISQAISRLFPGESGALCMLNASRNLLEAIAVGGDFQQDEGLFAPEDCWALRRGQAQSWTNAQSGLLCRHLGSSPVPGSLCVPVVAHGESMGLLHLRQAPSSMPAEATQAATQVRQSRAANFSAHVALALANLKLRESLPSQSIRDSLSGLFNRRYMEESFSREMRRAVRSQRPLSVLMMDIDHFKNFNDSFGHEAGDTLLAALGVFLRSHTRGEDLACRYGGEEFAIILPDAFAHKRAEQLREEVKNLQIQYHGLPLEKITLSIGVSSYPEDGDSPSNLLRIADAALYRAKNDGRNRVVVGQLMKDDAPPLRSRWQS